VGRKRILTYSGAGLCRSLLSWYLALAVVEDSETGRFQSAADGRSAQSVLLVLVAFDWPLGTLRGGKEQGNIQDRREIDTVTEVEFDVHTWELKIGLNWARKRASLQDPALLVVNKGCSKS
jgi:hypothetical protein